MREHANIRLLLYDYVLDELRSEERSRVEQHVRNCPACAESLERLRETCRVLNRRAGRPSQLQPDHYWENFATSVEARLQKPAPRRVHFPRPHMASFWSALQIRPRLAFGVGLVATAAVVGLLILRPAATVDLEPTPEVHPTQHPPTEEGAERLGTYLRQSHALLVGLTNKDVRSEDRIDLESEQRASRRLIEQSRRLRLQPLDTRSANLVSDVERIMISLANTKGTGSPPDLRMIQNGIRERNLLFKVRMAEQAYSSRRFVYASDRR